jgi:hypothetical protein
MALLTAVALVSLIFTQKGVLGGEDNRFSALAFLQEFSFFASIVGFVPLALCVIYMCYSKHASALHTHTRLSTLYEHTKYKRQAISIVFSKFQRSRGWTKKIKNSKCQDSLRRVLVLPISLLIHT